MSGVLRAVLPSKRVSLTSNLYHQSGCLREPNELPYQLFAGENLFWVGCLPNSGAIEASMTTACGRELAILLEVAHSVFVFFA